jgi:hypothetical protein
VWLYSSSAAREKEHGPAKHGKHLESAVVNAVPHTSLCPAQLHIFQRCTCWIILIDVMETRVNCQLISLTLLICNCSRRQRTLAPQGVDTGMQENRKRSTVGGRVHGGIHSAGLMCGDIGCQHNMALEEKIMV